ncbi:serine hydrolase domain-containing protein [Thermoflavifilum thermophilum]|uniref:CubicO group peptidase, beta-lactamase class C family n=1 Tax=Thermoflavifilum thermophilum TaxID=1393122 RepID=A0A1I7NL36_9BACT|nr:serine hydrolase domain-containing protein [Thermoflavifilum thermophilum]SFV35394.1 CubicO group peptidase, beta-lactamase class C family [Thermoflavifilum thermophilum]
MRSFSCLNFSLLVCSLLIFLVFDAGAQAAYPELNKIILAHQRVYKGRIYVVLEQNGHLVYQDSLGGYNRETTLPVASVSKWLSTALIMTFVDEGKIALDDPVGKYLPAFNKGLKSRITIRDCLRHTTGYFATPAFRRIYRRTNTLAACVQQISQQVPLEAEPGQAFYYSPFGLQIAGRVIEVVSGKSFVENFEERIARPCGMQHTSFARPANPELAGGVYSCPLDLLHFLEMIANKGVYQGHRILSEKALQEMQRNQIVNIPIRYSPVEGAIHQQWFYGLGEWVEAEDRDHQPLSVSSPGLFGSYPFYDISRQLIGIIFTLRLDFEDVMQADWSIRQAINQLFPSRTGLLEQSQQHEGILSVNEIP